MAYEQFANDASTSTTSAMAADSTSVTVADPSDFPSAGNFRIRVNDEIMLVTARSGSTFTVTRAQEGTTAAVHGSGSSCRHTLTRGSLLQLLADMNLRGAFASRPAAGVAGRKYHCTDTPFWYYDDGSTWRKYFGSYPIVTPDDSGYTWDNQSNTVRDVSKDMVTLSLPLTTLTGISVRYVAAPSTPYTITAAFLVNQCPLALIQTWLGFRASDGKMAGILAEHTSGLATINTWKMTSSTVFSAAYQGPNAISPVGGLLFFRIEDDATNFKFYISSDGVNFSLYDSRTRTDFLTPAQVFFAWGSTHAGTRSSSVSLIHWAQG